MRHRPIAAATAALALAVPATAGAWDAAQHPPKIPSSPAKAKHRCKDATRTLYGADYVLHVWVVRGAVSCATARRTVAKNPSKVKGFQFFDWTKGGNGRWTDVYARKRNKDVIGAELYKY